jgi:hypothetical protein
MHSETRGFLELIYSATEKTTLGTALPLFNQQVSSDETVQIIG